MHLKELRIGHKARVLSFLKGDNVLRKRLIAMGLLPGTEFKILRIAPFGDPIEIEVRGYLLSLRKQDVNILQVEPI